MKKDSTTILAIETSCDETAAAIILIDNNLLGNDKQMDINPNILSNIVFSQIEIHKKFGGVFPEVASRAHAEQIIPVIQEALKKSEIRMTNDELKSEANEENPKSKITNNEFESENRILASAKRITNYDIDIIAVTAGPGLIGSLLVGVAAAKSLAMACNIPIMPINHWLGHIYSCFTEQETRYKKSLDRARDRQDTNSLRNWKLEIRNSSIPQFPLLALIASGGHTGLVLMKSHTEVTTVGETLDDAAGEAFDKVAKILGLDYPGGPAISKSAERYKKQEIPRQSSGQANNKLEIKFPRAMLDRKDNLDFSFSGLKTSVLNKVRELSEKYSIDDFRDQVAYEFQQCVIDILIGKTLQAAEKYQPKSICLCGGVSANSELRGQMKEKIQSHKVTKSLSDSNTKKFQGHSMTQLLNDSVTFHVPPLNLTGDNAAMIGLAASYQLANGVKPTTFDQIEANSNLRL